MDVYQELLRRRTVVLEGEVRLPAGVPVIRVEDIGVSEPPEVTLLRVLAEPGLRERVEDSDVEELVGSSREFAESVIRLSRRVLRGFKGLVLRLDGPGQPLLDVMESLAMSGVVMVLAVTAPQDQRFPETLGPEAMHLYESLAALTTTGPLRVPLEFLTREQPESAGWLAGARLADVNRAGIRLHSTAAAEITRHWSPDETRSRAVTALRRLLDTHRPETVDRFGWTYVLLAGRLLDLSPDDRAGKDAVRSLTQELERSQQVLALAALWRFVGSPAVAPPRFQPAVDEWERGNLRAATRLLAEIPERRPADGWVLHTRAAVACDRGDLRGVGPLLRRAIEAHQVAGDRLGEAWAMLYYGRWRLLSGDFDEAEKVIDAARVAFQDVHDSAGVDWAGVEQRRLSLLLAVSGFTDDASPEPGFAMPRQESRRVDDWADLFSALSHASSWMQTPLVSSDQLYAAWSRHFKCVRTWQLAHSDTGVIIELTRNAEAFTRLGCPHGEAWTSLELAIRTPGLPSSPHTFAKARARFQSIGDEAGLAWVTLAQALADNEDPPPEALHELSRRYPPTLLATTEWPWEHGRFRIPFAARLLIPEPRYEGTQLRLPTTESRVRLTLHDDNRLTLQVIPGPNHPWSTTRSLPWLAARATPLTPIDIEPEHAVTIRPGPPDNTDAGAEFRFTPHRPGHHRIRFTVEHHLTGTVLQELETEFDVTDTPGADLTGTTPTSLGRT
ncbi:MULTISPECIES: M48 family metallopeptidase [unclassified Streptomyces]|uniref:tetratricopeptide repeat protein n=1 Tax=unclassified Streptomyces TaxID=2593676 RepID=UPI000DD68AC1|nr:MULTISPECIES: tetratricopeptide repeat protein [unclassified Streptomyces]QZZ29867.1 tetratricopeptide repeat protein [Streptomyces sp. ST1015]